MNDSDPAFNFIIAFIIFGVCTLILVAGYIGNDFGFRSGYCAALDGKRSGSVCLLPDGTFEEVQRD